MVQRIKKKSTGVNKSYTYRPNRVKRALDWLKINNPLYRDIKIEYPTDWNLNCHVDVPICLQSLKLI